MIYLQNCQFALIVTSIHIKNEHVNQVPITSTKNAKHYTQSVSCASGGKIVCKYLLHVKLQLQQQQTQNIPLQNTQRLN